MEIKDQCSVIVSSWDGFADCWPFFVHGLKKYWPDCPWRVLLMTTGSLPQFEGIETVNLQEDRGWASNLKRTLEHVSTPYVLYLQEDYWIEKPVNTAALANVLAEMRKQNAGYARIVPVPPPDQKAEAETGLGACSAANRYRVSLQAAFWKKNFLEKLLFDGENGLDFEHKGCKRSAALPEQCLASVRDLLPYGAGTAVRKGRWTMSAIRYAGRENMPLPYRKRENILDELCSKMGGTLAGKLLAFPLLRLMQCLRGDRKWRNYFK